MSGLTAYISGAITMGFLVAAVFYLRFWTRTRETLFLIFGGAFVLLALAQFALVLLPIPREEQASVYLLRAAAFALIIVGVLVKNAPKAR